MLTNTEAREIVREARRLERDIYAAPGGKTAILTILSDDRTEKHEVSMQFVELEGLIK